MWRATHHHHHSAHRHHQLGNHRFCLLQEVCIICMDKKSDIFKSKNIFFQRRSQRKNERNTTHVEKNKKDIEELEALNKSNIFDTSGTGGEGSLNNKKCAPTEKNSHEIPSKFLKIIPRRIKYHPNFP